jgi:hypothetical protein
MARLFAPLLALLLSGCAAHEFKSSADGSSSNDQTTHAKACPSIRSTLQAKADRIIANAGSVAGVKSVKFFIQLEP